MFDAHTPAVVAALSRAAAVPEGQPLYGTRTAPGLFAASAKNAAQRCKSEGFLRTLRTESKGKATREICAITDKGLDFLLRQADPKLILKDLVRALDARQAEMADLLDVATRTQTTFDSLKAAVEKALDRWSEPIAQDKPTHEVGSWTAACVAHLADWQASGALGDRPLPDLYRHLLRTTPALSIGGFHDGIRRLHQEKSIFVHPWTGPLYDLPEPSLALLVGHEIAYYASLRRA